jgi:hypothetical protein
MMVRSQLVKTFNTVICIGASFFAARIFLSSTLTNQIFVSLLSTISSRFDISILNLSIGLLKTMFLIAIIIFALFNLWSGKTSDIMRIYYLDLLLILPEVFAHSKFQWLLLFFGIDVYYPQKTFTETLFTCLIIIGGSMLLFFDSKFRENSEDFVHRGIDLAEVDTVYSNQFIFSLSFTMISFFLTIIISFLTDTSVNLIKPLTNISNANYILLGILSSVIISSTLYIFLKEQTK